MFLAKMPFGFILFFVSSPMGYSTRYYPPLGSSLSAYPFVQHSRSFCLFSSLPACLSILFCVSYSSTNPYFCLQAYLPLSLSLCPFFHTPVHTFICPPVCLCMYLTAMMRERRSQQSIDLRETERN